MLNDELGHTEWLRVHQLAAGEVDFRIRQILPEYWDASTPCDEWDVYDLVAHCVIAVSYTHLTLPTILLV